MVLKAGEPAYHDTTGLFKLGDGVTALSALSFLPTVSASTPTIQQVLTAGQVATTTIETTGFIKTGGTSTQFLKADGSVDSSTYLTTLGTAATSLTTTGSSGASTLIANVLNVPNYTLAGLGGTTLAAVNAQNLSVFAATTSSQLAGVISDETGSGSLVFGTSPTFTTNITTPLINGTSGTLQIGTTDLVNIGNKTTTSQRLVRIGQDTAWVDIGSLGGGGSANGAIYFNQTTPGLPNSALWGNASATNLNVQSGGNINVKFNNTDLVTMYGTLTGVNLPNFLITLPSMSTVTTTANSPSFRVTGANKQWATGALATQYFNYFTANTVSFVGASTATNVYGLYVEAATAGTNATITNNYAAGFSGRVNILSDTATIMIGSQVGSTARGAIYINQATPSTTNFALSAHQTTGQTYINGLTGVAFLFAGGIQWIISDKLATFGGGLTNYDFAFSSTNGTKLGTATTQKIGFWNATPIVQPTTAVAAATVVSGTGGNVKHDDTFDGYTLEKIVRALRTIGLLA
jgi:hypothetical protein